MAEAKFIAGPWRVDDDDRPGMAYNRHIVLDRDPDMRVCFMAHGGATVACGTISPASARSWS